MSHADTRENVGLPFAMLYRDSIPAHQRGYEPYPESWDYDPASQVSGLLRMGGETEPTTRSSVASTGVFDKDSDEANDDKGTD